VNHPSEEFFLAACGSSEPLRIGVGQRNETLLETRTFRQPFLVIGRRPESDLMLDHWQVSRRHAYLQLIEGQYYCVDLGSRTGTHGRDATERSGWLERGRAIQIGPYAVRPEWPSQSGQSFGLLPKVTWEMPGRVIGQAVWQMDRHLVLIGRSPACKIRIVESDVSRFHCSLVLTPNGVWVIDLLGQKGLFVNDEPVRCARLEDGDSLRVGRHVLRARYETEPAALPRPESTSSSPPQSNLMAVAPPSLFRTSSLGGELAARLMPPMPPANRDLANYLEKSGGVVDPSVNLLVHQFGMMQQQMFDQFHQTMMMMFEGFAALHREQTSSIHEEFDEVRRLSEEIEALRIETAKLAEATKAKTAERPRLATNGHSLHASQPTRTPSGNQAPSEPIKKANPAPPDPEVDIHAQLCLRLTTMQSERQNRWQKILGMMSSRS
jgi:pSer/pThr/pTyr-binding forkhead associated (FHA) protein